MQGALSGDLYMVHTQVQASERARIVWGTVRLSWQAPAGLLGLSTCRATSSLWHCSSMHHSSVLCACSASRLGTSSLCVNKPCLLLSAGHHDAVDKQARPPAR